MTTKAQLLDKITTLPKTDLSEEEKAIIAKGREDYKQGGFIPLENIG